MALYVNEPRKTFYGPINGFEPRKLISLHFARKWELWVRFGRERGEGAGGASPPEGQKKWGVGVGRNAGAGLGAGGREEICARKNAGAFPRWAEPKPGTSSLVILPCAERSEPLPAGRRDGGSWRSGKPDVDFMMIVWGWSLPEP